MDPAGRLEFADGKKFKFFPERGRDWDPLVLALSRFDEALQLAQERVAQTGSGGAKTVVATERGTVPPPSPPTLLRKEPPTIILLEPSVSASGQTNDANTSPLTIRGVATSTADFPVEGVSINGARANTKARTTQAVDFWSEPISLKAGENKFEVTAVNSAPASAKLSFTIRFTPMAPHYNPKALAKADILYLLKGDVSSARVAEMIKERGIKFNPTADDLSEIRSAGGSEDLIEVLRQAAGSSK